MKIGILTFHSQLNYGGVLQCWALQKALTRLLSEKLRVKSEECEVVVVDRWLDERNAALRREFAWLGWRGWLKLVIRGLLGCGDFGRLLRTIRTIRFVRGLGLTKEHFCEWEEIGGARGTARPTIAGENLDVLVVGSDQVWHCGDWGDPRPYLLEGAPKIRAISYAASFGLKELPADMIDLYKRGLGRFAALSCREKEGVEICRRLGFGATHVIDPTLLVDPGEWYRLVNSNTQTLKRTNNVLVCYFMSVDVSAALPLLENFAARMNCSVRVLVNDSYSYPAPRSLAAIVANFRRRRVKICRGYGPKEFVRAFSEATWTMADSFHAVMFSAIFQRNLRFIRPTEDWRRVMFARIEEFSKKCIEGTFFVENVEQALQSFECGEKITFKADQIATMRMASQKWLEDALKG